MNAEILQNYQTLVSNYQTLANSEKKQLKLISLARLISFLGIIPAYYYLSPTNGILAFGVSLAFLVSFLFLIRKYIQTEKQLLFYQRLTEINQNEIKALNRDFSSFDPGNKFIDPHHDYSYDLDLYGTGSFFQFMNRTVTKRGRKYLSSVLNHTQRTVEEIRCKQEALNELAGELTWRQNFMAKGKESEEPKTSIEIDRIIGNSILLKKPHAIKYLLLFLPPVTLILIGIKASGLTDQSFYLLALFAQWAIFLVYSKTISKFKKQFESQSKILNRYSEMLRLIEEKPFQSNYLINLKKKLTHNHKTAGQITAKLQKILSEFDYRQNILVYFVLNSVFLWDVRCIARMNDWQQKYAADFPHWFEVIAEMDALISLANCNYNHPNWTTPLIIPSKFQFKTDNLGHPLIDPNRCVCNSFQITGDEQIVIITGANMAGKSTFLRTVGINLILASNGCNVCAGSFEFTPTRIFTNMRTSDNLMNDESYFYAELLRLQNMLNLIRNGENLFVIIDEMLKGTNSIDKLNGSKELIRQLITLKTHGIVATHDLSLTGLSDNYPDSVKNQCFEVQLHDDELTFDYKLTDGVTRTMNATFLMKKMGIIPTY